MATLETHDQKSKCTKANRTRGDSETQGRRAGAPPGPVTEHRVRSRDPKESALRSGAHQGKTELSGYSGSGLGRTRSSRVRTRVRTSTLAGGRSIYRNQGVNISPPNTERSYTTDKDFPLTYLGRQKGSREECGMSRTKDDYLPTVSPVESFYWVRLLAHRVHSLKQ